MALRFLIDTINDENNNREEFWLLEQPKKLYVNDIALFKGAIATVAERGQRHARMHGYPQAALNRPRADESIVGYCRAENEEVSWLNNFKAYGRTRVDSSTLVHSRVSTWYM